MNLRVTVAVALASRQEVIEIELPEGATVANALEAARVSERFPELDLARATFGIWSRACSLSSGVQEGDRVEVYRPLRADPKDMRRARAGVRSSPRSRSGS